MGFILHLRDYSEVRQILHGLPILTIEYFLDIKYYARFKNPFYFKLQVNRDLNSTSPLIKFLKSIIITNLETIHCEIFHDCCTLHVSHRGTFPALYLSWIFSGLVKLTLKTSILNFSQSKYRL